MDLSAIREKESCGGERQDGTVGEGCSTWNALKEEGELVGMDEGEVEWDNEEGDFGAEEVINGEGGEGEMQEQEQLQDVQDEAAAAITDKPGESYEAYKPPAPIEPIAGPVGEMTGPGDGAVKAVAANAIAQQDTTGSEMQPIAQQDGSEVEDKLALSYKLSSSVASLESSWLNLVDLGLW
ncbi:hypothetical protein BU25DRAFT_458491 [Macroventuria anomochaeta]|uniref:Uncharacterized protein n=1 Tax=Macroventuria anomochaeta TaxID=301207 RepID=A0ACB6RZZ4_9PLEO|nr:uncharacterized protein BU25DRAFT_458491 [Macroventuria anomochaeta]KAF2627605.1 hypothetical protein BU25DRAFT_458491 [Macroventuria anomochaeta]